MRNQIRKIVAVDLFCGAGGLTKGLENAGINVKLGIDIDPWCAYPYETNTKSQFVLKSIKHTSSTEVDEAFGDARFRLLAGCAPCQPFSLYRMGKSDHTDRRWRLLKEFERIILASKSNLITMENVPRLADQRIFKKFVSRLEENGFEVWFDVVNSADYGVPQQRDRLVLMASRFGPVQLLKPTRNHRNDVSVEKAIGNLPPLLAGGTDKKDPLHQASLLSPINLRRIKASVPGGTWRDWHPELIAKCHLKKSGKTYPSVYGRMRWDEPAPTLTGQFFGFGNGRFGHPEQNRAISLREGAILQSFPRNYRFTKPGDPIFRKRVGLLIGNAVPVKLAQAIGRSMLTHVQNLSSIEKQAR